MNTDLFLWTEGCHMPGGTAAPGLAWVLGPWTFLPGRILVTRAGDGQAAPRLSIQHEGGRNTTGLTPAGSKPTSLRGERSSFQRGRQLTWQQGFTTWGQGGARHGAKSV